MRLDLFLKRSALIKRRTIAKAMCDAGRIQRNGRTARAADPVSIGDTLHIDFGGRLLQVEVAALPQGAGRNALHGECYRIISEERRVIDEF
jgi:ribosomal 50S subunit-recycling heat shock protein